MIIAISRLSQCISTGRVEAGLSATAQPALETPKKRYAPRRTVAELADCAGNFQPNGEQADDVATT